MNRITILALCFTLCVLSSAGHAELPLSLQRSIPLPGIGGKFDHFAIDLKGNRLFIAATGNHSVEVIDLTRKKVVQSIAGLGKPHGLVWIESTNSLYVADGLLAELLVYQVAQDSTLKPAGQIKLSDDADDLVYNPATHLLYVGHGGSNAANPARIAVIDTSSFTLKANIQVAAHPEALDLDAGSHRVFANIADASEVAVLSGTTNQVEAQWKLTHAADNVPLAFDPVGNVLYLAARTPASVIALNANTGAEIARLPAASGADDLFYDPALRRVYVICGAGEVDVYEADANKALHALGKVPTEAGAKTALFVPSQSLLYVGVPGDQGKSAEIRIYSTAKGSQ